MLASTAPQPGLISPPISTPSDRPSTGSGGDRASEATSGRAASGSRASRPDQAAQPEPSSRADSKADKAAADNASLTREERQRVRELKRRDRQVRQHEQAHVSAGGSVVEGGPSFEFTRGPDGKRYAVSGSVQIDSSKVRGDPQATIEKMRQVRRAALAPAQPSGQDRQVARKAAQAIQEARAKLNANESAGPGSSDSPSDDAGRVSADRAAPGRPGNNRESEAEVAGQDTATAERVSPDTLAQRYRAGVDEPATDRLVDRAA